MFFTPVPPVRLRQQTGLCRGNLGARDRTRGHGRGSPRDGETAAGL